VFGQLQDGRVANWGLRAGHRHGCPSHGRSEGAADEVAPAAPGLALHGGHAFSTEEVLGRFAQST
jgi:hypothetical protein